VDFIQGLIAGRAAQFPRNGSTTFKGGIVVRAAIDMIDEKKCNNGAGTWAKR